MGYWTCIGICQESLVFFKKHILARLKCALFKCHVPWYLIISGIIQNVFLYVIKNLWKHSQGFTVFKRCPRIVWPTLYISATLNIYASCTIQSSLTSEGRKEEWNTKCGILQFEYIYRNSFPGFWLAVFWFAVMARMTHVDHCWVL